MITREFKFAEVGVPSYSGVIYNEEAMNKIKEAFLTRDVFGYFNDGTFRSASNPSHIMTKFREEDGAFYGTLLVLDNNPDGVSLREALYANKAVNCAVSGFGRIVDNVITDFQFMGVNVVADNIEVI